MSEATCNRLIAKVCTVMLDEWDDMTGPEQVLCAKWLLNLARTIVANPKAIKQYFKDAIDRC